MKSVYRISIGIAVLTLLTALSETRELYLASDKNEPFSHVMPRANFVDSINNPFLIDTLLLYGPNPADNSDYPVIAFDGTNYLIVWHDDRDGDWDIFASRLSQNGELIDEMGIPISSTSHDEMYPDVAFDGINYMIVWEGETGIEGVIVTPSCVLLNSMSISPTGTQPSVGYGAGNYFIVWQEYRNSNWSGIYGTRVDTSGSVIDTMGIAVAVIDSVYQRYPDIAFDGTNFLVVWAHNNFADWKVEICATRVNQDGQTLDTTCIQIFSEPKEYNGTIDPVIAFNGTNYLVAWEYYAATLDYIAQTRAARVDQNGNVLDPNGFMLDITGNLNDNPPRTYPSIAFDGSNFLVTWTQQTYTQSDPLCGQRVTQMGTLLDSLIIISEAPNRAYSSNVVFGDSSYFVAWADQRSGISTEIYGARVDTCGSVLDSSGIPISFSDSTVYAQHEPCIAFNGSNFLLAWEDEYGIDIFGVRVTQSGTTLDSTRIPISNSDDKLLIPKIAFRGSQYAVIWNSFDYRGYIRATRICSSGVVLDTGGVTLTGPSFNSSSDIAIACDDVNYFIAQGIDYCYYTDDYRRIVGTFTDQFLHVISSFGFPFENYTFKSNPCISFDGTNYFLVHDQYGMAGSGIRGFIVNYSGYGQEIVISETGRYPAVDFDGSNYLVVWQSGNNIYGRMVSPSGVSVDSIFPICTAPNEQKNVAIAFDGVDYLIVWQDKRSGEWDIYGARVDTSGNCIASFCVSQQPGDQICPALAHGVGNQTLIVYSGWVDVFNGRPVYSMRIWGVFSTNIGTEEEVALNVDNTQMDLWVHPNPFHGNVNIALNAGCLSGRTRLAIYDVTGRVVKVLPFPATDQEYPAFISWNGTDDLNTRLPSGVYFLKLELRDYSITRKLLMIK